MSESTYAGTPEAFGDGIATSETADSFVQGSARDVQTELSVSRELARRQDERASAPLEYAATDKLKSVYEDRVRTRLECMPVTSHHRPRSHPMKYQRRQSFRYVQLINMHSLHLSTTLTANWHCTALPGSNTNPSPFPWVPRPRTFETAT